MIPGMCQVDSTPNVRRFLKDIPGPGAPLAPPWVRTVRFGSQGFLDQISGPNESPHQMQVGADIVMSNDRPVHPVLWTTTDTR